MADIYVVKKAAQAAPGKTNTTSQDYVEATQHYYVASWSKKTQDLSDNHEGFYKEVSATGYLALRSNTTYDDANEIGRLYTGERVQILGGAKAATYGYTARNMKPVAG